ncbi:hypothetical protein AwPolaro_11360 [Polaromonas sp.]|nr:hypothetical protein AwPolaro_11360 [Polaromonas sp.]
MVQALAAIIFNDGSNGSATPTVNTYTTNRVNQAAHFQWQTRLGE